MGQEEEENGEEKDEEEEEEEFLNKCCTTARLCQLINYCRDSRRQAGELAICWERLRNDFPLCH